jgi:hypothetical protein
MPKLYQQRQEAKAFPKAWPPVSAKRGNSRGKRTEWASLKAKNLEEKRADSAALNKIRQTKSWKRGTKRTSSKGSGAARGKRRTEIAEEKRR